ncbi:MAG TPA: ROK family protein [Roseiflexaceae bacterium]|jgi:predicted NBD/HSP70 family sugar kinase|nr:ROK family protein [Roseiflexaceae bacterium]
MFKTSTKSIRRSNTLRVLQRIYASAPVTRPELTHSTGLSPATIANVVADLIKANIVVEDGFKDSDGGRPRAMLNINADYGVFVGVDIAETYIHFELFDLMLHNRCKIESPLSLSENQPAHVVDHVVRGINQLFLQSHTSDTQVLGVGISIPGLLEQVGGVSVFAPKWGSPNMLLARMLSERIDLPLYLDNPLKACAVAELWFGMGQQKSNLVTLIIGTGVGAGIILNSAVYRGATNSAGEWGHTTIVLDGRECRCGSHGCLEAYIGAPGILQNLRELAPDSPLLQTEDQTESIHGLANAVREGDPVAMHVIRTTARHLGAGIANIINVFNPEAVVIGGWVGMLLGPYLLPELEEFVAHYALEQPRKAATFQLCQINNNPVSLGMATLALEGYLAANDVKSVRA